ncbi:MAG: type I-C CRISPR-associated protein Cas5 [Proteobacteria bacterium]|nr:type I-C CRISPR-associated protein Cas5 [Pseudomonadota bacterium]
MPRTYCLEVTGDFACFTRPEMKVERVSYDVITPSAARAVFEAILWKPAIRWVPTKIEVLAPVRWVSVRRNEVGSKVSVSNRGIYAEDDRQQRAGLFLCDVKYRLYAHFEMTERDHRPNYPRLDNIVQDEEEEPLHRQPNTPEKFLNMFERRAKKGQCINQPYLGCREFACDFRLVEKTTNEPAPINETRGLGWMLYDMDYSNPADPMPRFFDARMMKGAIEIPDWNSEEVRG